MERSIVEWSVRALLMVIGTGLIVGSLRIRAASALHRAWTAAMVAMLLLPVWTKWGPSVNTPVLPAVQERFRIEMPAQPDVPLGAVLPLAQVSQTAVFGRSGSIPQPPSPDWQMILLSVYLAGFAVMLVRLIRGTLSVRSMLRNTRDADGFVKSPLCNSPFTMGWLRPSVLLPDCWQTWPAAKLEAVLIHEREHIRRRDPLVQWL